MQIPELTGDSFDGTQIYPHSNHHNPANLYIARLPTVS